MAAQLERRLAALERRIATEGSEAAITEAEEVAGRRSEAGVAEAAEARALGSVTASARCREGYVADGSARVSAADVAIVAEQQVDCDAAGCRAFQVTARRDSEDPFDLQVSVTCTG